MSLKALLILCFCILMIPLRGQYPSHSQLVEYTEHCVINGKSLVVEKSFILQINDPLGETETNIYISFKKGEKPKHLKAAVLSADGKLIRKLKKSEIEIVSRWQQSTFYSDEYWLKFRLRHNVYPYRIKYSYSQKSDDFIALTYWQPILYKNTPTLHASLKVDVPADYPITIFEKNLTHNTKAEDDRRIYSWETSFNKTFPDVAMGPERESILPHALVLPLNFTYGAEGSYKSWDSFGAWMATLNDDILDLPDKEKKKVAELTATLTDPFEKTKVLYHYLQDNTRYINISIDLGGYKSYPASYVCQTKYGDCKALSTYMKALLKEAGIESFYTLVWGGENCPPIPVEFPSPQFNHVILCVPLNGDTLWMDNTSNTDPFNYLGTFTQNRKALFINHGGKLLHTPALSLDDVKIAHLYTITPTADTSTSQITIHSQARGPFFEYLRYFQKNGNKKELEQSVENFYSIPALKIEQYQLHQFHRDSASIEVSVKGLLDKYPSEFGNTSICSLPALKLPVFENVQKRTLPVVIPYPYNINDSVTIRLEKASNSKVDFPAERQIDNTFGSYSTKFYQSGNNLIAIRHFQLKSQHIPLNQYPLFYQFMEDIQLAEQQFKIILNKKT